MRHAIVTGLVAALFVVGTCGLAEASGRKAQPPQKKLQPATAFDKADANHDGAVSKSEFARYEKSQSAAKREVKPGTPKAVTSKPGTTKTVTPAPRAPKAAQTASKGKPGAPVAHKDMRREGPATKRGQKPAVAREGRDGRRGERIGQPERRGSERARVGFDAEARRADLRRRFEREHGPAGTWSPEMRRRFKETMHREMKKEKSQWKAAHRGMRSREGMRRVTHGSAGMAPAGAPGSLESRGIGRRGAVGRPQMPGMARPGASIRGEQGMGMRGQGWQGRPTDSRSMRPEGMTRESGVRGTEGMSAQQRREVMRRLWSQTPPDERRALLREMAGAGSTDGGRTRDNARSGQDRQELSGQEDVLENWQLLKDMGLVP